MFRSILSVGTITSEATHSIFPPAEAASEVINRITVWPSQRLRSATKDHCDVNLISDALPFGRLWYGEPNAISNAKFYSRSNDVRDSGLRRGTQRDRDARAQERF